MDAKTLNALRTVLLIAILIMLSLTAFLFVRNGVLSLPIIIIAAGCLLIYLVTKRKQN